MNPSHNHQLKSIVLLLVSGLRTVKYLAVIVKPEKKQQLFSWTTIMFGVIEWIPIYQDFINCR